MEIVLVFGLIFALSNLELSAGSLEEMYFFHNTEKLCDLSEVLVEKNGDCNYQNGYCADRMEAVWRVILLVEVLW